MCFVYSQEASDLPEINLDCLSLALDVLPFSSFSISCHSLSAAWLCLVTVRNVDFKQGGNTACNSIIAD
jgi:hypothetical protein